MKCWYCSVRDAQDKDNYVADMYGSVASKSVDTQTNVAYNVRHLVIPRCSDCHAKHSAAKLFFLLFLVFSTCVLVSFFLTVFSVTNGILAGILLGVFAGLSIAALLAERMVQKGISTIHTSRKKYPEIVELLGQCYRFGVRPKEKIPTSDPPCEKSKEPDTVKK